MTFLFGSGDSEKTYTFNVDQHETRAVILPQWYSTGAYLQWQSVPIYGPVVATGDRLVYQVGPKQVPSAGVLLSVSDSLTGSAERLATNVKFHDGLGPYFAAATPGAIWATRRVRRGTYRAVELNADTGQVLIRSGTLGVGYPVAFVRNGLLIETSVDHHRRRMLQIRDVSSGRRSSTITRDASADLLVLAAGGNIVVWQRNAACSHCEIHLSNTTTGADIPVRWPSDAEYQCLSGTLSPNARWFAVVYGCQPPADRKAVILVNTRTGQARAIAASHGALIEQGPFWSPNGDWMFWVRGSNSQDVTVLAYRLGSHLPRVFRVAAHGRALLGAFTTIPLRDDQGG